MDANRLRTGELIAGVGAVALVLIMLIFTWFSIDLAPGVDIEAVQDQAEELGVPAAVPENVDDSVGFNAFESFDFIDLVLVLTALVAGGLAVATAMARTVALPVAASAITAGLGILSTILILYRILDPPFEADRSIGVFLGLVAAAAIAYGGWRSMQEEGTTFAGEADRLGDRVGDREPPPPPPPPPPAGGTGAPPAGGPTP